MPPSTKHLFQWSTLMIKRRQASISTDEILKDPRLKTLIVSFKQDRWKAIGCVVDLFSMSFADQEIDIAKLCRTFIPAGYIEFSDGKYFCISPFGKERIFQPGELKNN